MSEDHGENPGEAFKYRWATRRKSVSALDIKGLSAKVDTLPIFLTTPEKTRVRDRKTIYIVRFVRLSGAYDTMF